MHPVYLSQSCTNSRFRAGWPREVPTLSTSGHECRMCTSSVPPLHQGPVLLCILPGTEGIGYQRRRFLLVDGDGNLERLVHVVVFVEVEWRNELLEGRTGTAALSFSLTPLLDRPTGDTQYITQHLYTTHGKGCMQCLHTVSDINVHRQHYHYVRLFTIHWQFPQYFQHLIL